jgi:hypothetical protein
MRLTIRRRRTEIGSVAAPRSPRPNLREPPSDLFVVDTPSTASPARSRTSSASLSPSPVKVAVRSPGKEKRQRKRRESGCLEIPPREASRSDQATQEHADWEEGSNIVIPPSKAVHASKTMPATQPATAVLAIPQDEQITVSLQPETIVASASRSSASSPAAKISWRTKKAADAVVGIAEGVDGVVGGKGKAKAVEALVIAEAVEAEIMSGKQTAQPLQNR